MNEIEALSVLSTVPGLGSVRIRRLVEHFGSALATLTADAAAIEGISGCSTNLATAIRTWYSQGLWENNLRLAEKHGATLIPYTSPHYPQSLLHIHDHPILLYTKGQFSPDKRNIAVIGTRQASIYGLEMATKISAELASMGFSVVSGLARGIDSAAHKGALQAKGGRTLAVIGSGLADIYPPENVTPLSEQIARSGMLISEFPMATPPDPQNFPQRNRIVSGLSQGVLLIEAPKHKSGAMITMEIAKKQGKRLFVLPGRADSGSFTGNHYLIQQGATLVTSASDIANSFEDLFGQHSLPVNPLSDKKTIALAPEEERILSQLPSEEMVIDDIATLTQTPITQLNVLLMRLELKKIVKKFHGNVYKKVI